MIVCVCHRVRDRTIAQGAQAGMAFEELQFACGVATRCGKCEEVARATWESGRSVVEARAAHGLRCATA
ncbi:MAG: hypothetical protein RIS35_770 [Pseudomonadota bacterium]